MEIVLRDPSKIETFTMIFQHVKLFTDHINLFMEKERFFVQLMDKSHVSIFEIYLPSTWFDEYHCQRESGFRIGIHSSVFFKVLGTCDKRQQQLQIQFDEDDSDKLFVNFTSMDTDANTSASTNTSTNKEFDKHFEIPLMDIDSETMHIPMIDYQAEFSIPSATFANMISQLKMFGDTLDIACSEEAIQMSSISNEAGKMSVDIPINDLNSFAIEEGQQLNLSFSLLHLYNICMYSKLSKDIDIFITTEYPIKLVYRLFGSEDSRIVFYLAPKISDNE